MIQATLPRASAPPPLDLSKLAGQVLQPWADAYDVWRSGLDSWRSGVADAVRPSPSSQCGCPVCAPDPCQCRCCVADADLVIEARVGERRIVPVIIENRWRRARDVEVELSGWSKISDTVQVTGELLGDAAFTLAPCGHQQHLLVVNIGGQQPGDQRQLLDVDRCLVAYADLRINGCDLRAVRVAVAVTPRDCEAFTVDCGCACCC